MTAVGARESGGRSAHGGEHIGRGLQGKLGAEPRGPQGAQRKLLEALGRRPGRSQYAGCQVLHPALWIYEYVLAGVPADGVERKILFREPF